MKAIGNMKKILFFLLLIQCFAWSMAFAQTTAIKEAEEAYTKEDYNKAIELYENILKSNGESAEIFYNLGNAYYKAGKIAPAILNYERALVLDPGDADARFNLQLARQKSVDKIEPVENFFLTDWFDTIQNTAAADSWARIGIVCFIFFIGCVILFFFSRWIRLKKVGFYLGLVLLVMVIFANIFAKNQKDELVNRKHAIVFTPTVTVKSSPDASGTDLFILHEGTKVSVKSTLGDWSEIELEDGNIGWMPSKDIEKI
ncbi:tetratricopeptide repeat protein [Parabacteroides bouchesdurhonensis]|uniref:tetratricopeptide repeat protein n=1 Tax=Parabacteroides bouchesdurhonensis TaxID=1936995 RepID=UPI000E50601D|nr:tetratricopeptide repeat protein [Parabacteroides bouchesdurhonensis]RHJ91451.1 tetratricopeptide repeat protein [Bacteroides sp. AM07-16]